MALWFTRKRKAADGDYDDDEYYEEEDSLEGKIVAVFLAVLAVGFIAFVVAVPYMDKDGAIRQTVSGMGLFKGGSGEGGAGLGGGGGGDSGGGSFSSGEVRPGGFGPVDIGMTAQELKQKSPASFYRGAGGRLVANLRGMNAAYTAWFTSSDESGVVSRMRMDRLFPGGSIDDAIGYVSKGLGEPVHSRCSGSAAKAGGARECQMRWKTRGGVTVNAKLRQETDSGGRTQTTASMTASSN
ncbi:MAG: hypothetical protein ACYYKD_10050 [Rhodospirillales bacterium]